MINIKKLHFLIVTVAASAQLLPCLQHSLSAQPQTRSYLYDTKAGARGKNFDTEHLLLEVSFEPEKGLVKGKVTLSFTILQQQTDTLFLDAPGINVKTLAMDGKETAFTMNASGITVKPAEALKWDSKHQLTIEYELAGTTLPT
jgi:aminopeptidase N